MKLLIGSGVSKLDGYKTVDLFVPADYNFNLEEPIPLEEKSVEEIIGYHVIEHLDHRKVVDAVRSWQRVLIPGGKLLLEFPDLDAVIQWYHQEQSNKALEWLFGTHDRPGQVHKWGYTKESMKALLVAAGFTESTILFTDPQDYHKKDGPCLRVEAQKL